MEEWRCFRIWWKEKEGKKNEKENKQKNKLSDWKKN